MLSRIAMAALLWLSPSLAAQPQKEAPTTFKVSSVRLVGVEVSQNVRLQHADAASIAAILQMPRSSNRFDQASGAPAKSSLPVGIRSIIAEVSSNSLWITGTPEAVAAVRKRIDALDVKQRTINMHFKVLRFDFDEAGSWDMRIVSEPTLSTLDEWPATISIQGDDDATTIDVTPHLLPNGSIVLDGALRTGKDHSAFRREMTARKSAILVGVTSSTSAAIRKAAAIGHVPAATGDPFTIFYLQVASVSGS